MNFIQYKNLLSTKKILRPQLFLDKTVIYCNKIIRYLCLCENSVFSPLFPVVMFGGSQAAAVSLLIVLYCLSSLHTRYCYIVFCGRAALVL